MQPSWPEELVDSVVKHLHDYRDLRRTGDAYFMNYIWDWATERGRQQGHPYYAILSAELKAIVRSHGR